MQKEQESLVVRREIDRVNVGGPTLQVARHCFSKDLENLNQKAPDLIVHFVSDVNLQFHVIFVSGSRSLG